MQRNWSLAVKLLLARGMGCATPRASNSAPVWVPVALPGERARHLDRRLALLGAGKAMREHRRPAHQPGRHFERPGEVVAARGRDGDLFGGHIGNPEKSERWRVAISPTHANR